jgi:Cu/Ag efflux pump CusA
MARPAAFGQAIILLVYAPLLMFEGVEGKMFGPMAATVMLALAGRLRAELHLRAGPGRAVGARSLSGS